MSPTAYFGSRSDIILCLCSEGDWAPKALINNPAFDHFVSLVHNRHWTQDALRQAWLWFLAGWYADKDGE